jgi:hypothetical protein
MKPLNVNMGYEGLPLCSHMSLACVVAQRVEGQDRDRAEGLEMPGGDWGEEECLLTRLF